MTDEKLNIVLAPPKDKKIEFQDYEITVRPYFTIQDRIYLVRVYLDALFEDSDKNLANRYVIAEQTLKLEVIGTNTNIEPESLNPEYMVTSGLWGEVIAWIPDYELLRKDIDRVLELHYKDLSLEKSVGNVLDGLVVKLAGVLDQLSEIDAESMKEASGQFVSELEKLNEKFPGIAGKPARRRKTKTE